MAWWERRRPSNVCLLRKFSLRMASDVLNVSRSPQFFGPHAGLSTFLGTCLCGILTRPWRQPGHFLPTPRVVGFSSGPTSVGFYEDLAPILMFANSKSSWFFSLGQAVCPCRIFTERWRRPGPLAVEVPRGWQLTFGIFCQVPERLSFFLGPRGLPAWNFHRPPATLRSLTDLVDGVCV